VANPCCLCFPKDSVVTKCNPANQQRDGIEQKKSVMEAHHTLEFSVIT